MVVALNETVVANFLSVSTNYVIAARRTIG